MLVISATSIKMDHAGERKIHRIEMIYRHYVAVLHASDSDANTIALLVVHWGEKTFTYTGAYKDDWIGHVEHGYGVVYTGFASYEMHDSVIGAALPSMWSSS